MRPALSFFTFSFTFTFYSLSLTLTFFIAPCTLSLITLYLFSFSLFDCALHMCKRKYVTGGADFQDICTSIMPCTSVLDMTIMWYEIKKGMLQYLNTLQLQHRWKHLYTDIAAVRSSRYSIEAGGVQTHTGSSSSAVSTNHQRCYLCNFFSFLYKTNLLFSSHIFFKFFLCCFFFLSWKHTQGVAAVPCQPTTSAEMWILQNFLFFSFSFLLPPPGPPFLHSFYDFF